MQVQRRRPCLKAQVGSLQRLAIEVDVHPLRTLDLDPWQPGPNEQAVTAQKVPQSPHHFLWCRQNSDVKQTVVDHGFGAQHLPAPSLSAIADTQRQQIPLPMEAWPL
ncbi:hypothetical protein D3C75_1175640 [compost metagenome]